ncbi:hypothetical protein N0V88_002797 [Collariella sp. IMI 366227]|nr:hypothetical protein N0V88_002797 [Collariella sp. IMI 366227]
MYPVASLSLILQEHPHLEKDGFVLLDAWPIGPAMLYVFDPEMSSQFTQVRALSKADIVGSQLYPLTEAKDIATLDGAEWKFWRTVFNPGFSAKNLTTMVPGFLEEIKVFVDTLRQAAKSGEVLRIETAATNLALDVIGRTILDKRLYTQTKSNNPLQWALNKQASWVIPSYAPHDLVKLLNPFRPLLLWNYRRVLRNYLLPDIHQNIAAQAAGNVNDARTKTIVALASKAYLAEKPQSSKPPAPTAIADKTFIDMVIPQLAIFFFAGYETTAASICFVYHLLSTHPDTLAALRAEHDAVFGPDSHSAEAKIIANPQLLNALPYTAAIIKESLRIFPPGATFRQGRPDFFLSHPSTGRRYPTDGFIVHQNTATHRLESVFPQPHRFLPERFLVAEGEPLHPRNAYRPFELGARIELAQLEMRMVLVLTAREFEIESVGEEMGLPEMFRREKGA